MIELKCDWCAFAGQTTVAYFVCVTADTDTELLEDWFICMKHADHLCSMRDARRIMISGVAIDVWQLNSITPKARDYAKERAD